jgi:hypothetical protein
MTILNAGLLDQNNLVDTETTSCLQEVTFKAFLALKKLIKHTNML